MSKTIKIIIGIIIIIIVIGGIWYGVSKQPKEKGVIKIGGIFALTGIGTSFGQEELNGVELAIKEINDDGGILGRKLKLVVEDVSVDKLNTAGASINKLVNVDKVIAIIGPTWDEPAQVILPITEEAKVPTIGPDQTDNIESQKNYDYFFSTWFDDKVGIKKILAFAQEKQWNNIAIIRLTGGGFYQYTRNILMEFASTYGINIVEDIDIGNIAETDFRTSITKIKTKKPDALFIVLNDFTECAFMKQVKELQFDKPVLSTESAGNFASLNQCSNLLENLYFSFPKMTSNYQNFTERFKKYFGKDPQYPSTLTAYDALGIIALALKRTNLEGGQRLRDEISEIKNYKGISLENMSFNPNGFVNTPDDTFEIKIIKNGQFVPYEENK